ncbi:protein naked cuticle homolog [Culicoides brevitarsis]|uniref:protein naked cuticle homolog n=1 Tax=Culicoides brevitarsis TaxID=469753 RepID=UPI00307C4F6F
MVRIEFTCDVSLEDDSKQQPLQFSFTLYDLDGHGKITKDDIAGIVSTIYESIGKSVVVPHYGSKTINVRLTVSPDSKTRPHYNNTKKDEISRRNRCRPRKLISDEDEVDEENCSETSCEKQRKRNDETNRLSKDCSTTTTATTATDSENRELMANNKTRVCFNDTSNECFNNKLTNVKQNGTPRRDDIYENVNNLKAKQDEDYLIDMNSCHNEEYKNNDIDNCNIICKECPVESCPFDLVVQKSNKKRLIRKSRSRKQKNVSNDANVKPRARSLSVGHENLWKNDIRNEEQQCWKSPLKRHELIEIIRESMEKNRLCFQPNRKSIETPTKHRNRSHTMTTKVIDALNQVNVTPKHVSNGGAHHESNLCGYDSFLHATICTNAKNGVHLSSSPMVITGPNRLTHHHNKNRLRTKHHHTNYHQVAAPQTQHPSRETAPMKLSTSLLNQLNPNLSAEQKINRSINHVELWLETKDIRGSQTNNELIVMKNTLDDKSCLNNNNHVNNNNKPTNLDTPPRKNNDFTETELKITEDDFVDIVSPKKTFNKEVLISSATRKHIKTQHNNVDNEPTTPNNQRTDTSKTYVLEYASIPVTAEPSECENLLLKDAEDENGAQPATLQANGSGTENAGSTTTSNTTPSTVHRYVHIHHHYHHFNAEDEE